jgi:acyl carrier protein
VANITLAEVERRVKKIIAEQACVDESEVTNDTTYLNLDLDSLDSVELRMAMEDEFGGEIDSNEFALLNTVQQVIDFIAARGD